MADVTGVGVGAAVLGLLGWVASWFTPEKVDQRLRADLEKCKKERDALLSKESTPANRRRYVAVCDKIAELDIKLRR